MDRRRAAALVIGLLAALLGPAGEATAATGTADVEDYRFAPTEVRIEPGDRVRWTNRGEKVHTVSSDDPGAEDFDSGRLGTGDEYTHTFSKPGRFAYHCEIHDSMSGVIEVGGSPTTTSSSTTTTRPPTTTTTQPPTTTTTRVPAPTTTTTTAPAPPPTTATTSRGPTGAASPAPATTAPTTATTGPAVTTTTTAPATTTTTAPPETTTTTAAGGPPTPLGPEVPPRPPAEEDGEGDLAGDNVASPRSRGSDGGPDAGVLLLMLAVLGAGAFGGWTLWKFRPGNTS